MHFVYTRPAVCIASVITKCLTCFIYVVVVGSENGFHASNSRTRANHQFKYKHIQVNTTVFRYSFFVATIPSWNSLQAETVGTGPPFPGSAIPTVRVLGLGLGLGLGGPWEWRTPGMADRNRNCEEYNCNNIQKIN